LVGDTITEEALPTWIGWMDVEIDNVETVGLNGSDNGQVKKIVRFTE
jgi:hypothetical protein